MRIRRFSAALTEGFILKNCVLRWGNRSTRGFASISCRKPRTGSPYDRVPWVSLGILWNRLSKLKSMLMRYYPTGTIISLIGSFRGLLVSRWRKAVYRWASGFVPDPAIPASYGILWSVVWQRVIWWIYPVCSWNAFYCVWQCVVQNSLVCCMIMRHMMDPSCVFMEHTSLRMAMRRMRFKMRRSGTMDLRQNTVFTRAREFSDWTSIGPYEQYTSVHSRIFRLPKAASSQNTSVFSVIFVTTRQPVSVPAQNSSAFNPDVSMKKPVRTTMRQRAKSNHLHNCGVAISHITPLIVASSSLMWGSVQTNHHEDMDGNTILDTFGLETLCWECSNGLCGSATVPINISASSRHLLHSVLHLSPHQPAVFAAVYLRSILSRNQ